MSGRPSTGPTDAVDLEAERVFASVARSLLGEDSAMPQVGRFELRGKIGAGAMGDVFSAYDPQRRREVAVKVLRAAHDGEASATQRLQREARALARLRHPNIVQIYEVGEHDGRPFIAMELLCGRGLDDRLRAGPMDPMEVSTVIADVCAAMACAHAAAIVHRDLKPANIYLVDEPERRAKVVDFGVAKGLSTATVGGPTASGAVLGTPHYMSPEQARDSSKVDAHADLWAVAIIAYECILGRRPFTATNLPDLAVQLLRQRAPVPSEHGAVPHGFDRWFARATHRDPSKRFASAAELARALSAVLRPKAPRRWGLWLAVIAVATTVGAATWVAGRTAPSRGPSRARSGRGSTTPSAPLASPIPPSQVSSTHLGARSVHLGAPPPTGPVAGPAPPIAEDSDIVPARPTAMHPAAEPDNDNGRDSKRTRVRRRIAPSPTAPEHDVADLEL